MLCVWRGGIGKYYLNSEKLGFNMDRGPQAIPGGDMIVKYFHYHVGSCVSKNTRGGDTIRLLIKLIVMEEYCASGEEVLGNTI